MGIESQRQTYQLAEGANITHDSSLPLSISEQIARDIAEEIITGEYEPGQRIIEQRLSDQFSVSRGPIREALRLLEAQGLITIQPRRGAHVALLSQAEVHEIYEIRAVLFGLVARRIANGYGPNHTEQIANISEKLNSLAEAGQTDDYVKYSFSLTLFLADVAGNPRASKTLHALALQTRRYARIACGTRESLCRSCAIWQELCGALAKGASDESERLARRVVQDAAERIAIALN